MTIKLLGLGLFLSTIMTACSSRQLTPEEHCCKHKARHQAQFARSLGLSPPAPIVYRKYYAKCMERGRCREPDTGVVAPTEAGDNEAPLP